MSFFTFGDSIEHALDYLGGTSDALAARDCRRAVLAAYREVTNARAWSYLFTHGRIITNPPYITGTIAYDHTGGNYEREVLLYGGTWPAWVGPGSKLRVGVVTHDVEERKSDTFLTLASQVNPGIDLDLNRIAITDLTLDVPIVITSVAHGRETGDIVIVEGVDSTELLVPVISSNGTWTITVIDPDTFSLDTSDGTSDTPWQTNSGTWRLPPTTSFTLYHDDYLLPADFVRQDTAIFEGNFGGLTYSDPTDQLWWQRFMFSSGTPRFYCIRGNPLFPGRLTIGFSPYPDQSKSIDFIYQRRSRGLRYDGYVTGTVSVDAVNLPTIVNGNGTVFDRSMVGSVLRVGTAREAPTSWVGANPPAVETVILEVLTPSALRVADAFAADQVAVKYVISDPIDVEQGCCLTAFLRGVEKQLTIARSVKEDKADAFAAYDMALKEAQAADSRSFQGRSMGGQRSRSVPYKYMPANFFP